MKLRLSKLTPYQWELLQALLLLDEANTDELGNPVRCIARGLDADLNACADIDMVRFRRYCNPEMEILLNLIKR